MKARLRNGGEDIFLDKHLQLDLSSELSVDASTAAFLELVNLTNEPFRTYQGVQRATAAGGVLRELGTLGLRYTDEIARPTRSLEGQ